MLNKQEERFIVIAMNKGFLTRIQAGNVERTHKVLQDLNMRQSVQKVAMEEGYLSKKEVQAIDAMVAGGEGLVSSENERNLVTTYTKDSRVPNFSELREVHEPGQNLSSTKPSKTKRTEASGKKNFTSCLGCFVILAVIVAIYGAAMYVNKSQRREKRAEYDRRNKRTSTHVQKKNGDKYYEKYLAQAKKAKGLAKISYLDKAIKERPNDPAAYYERGLTYSNANNTLKAIDDFTKAIKKSRTPHADALYSRALAFFTLKKYALAQNDLDRAIAIKPNASAYYMRGIVSRVTGKKQAALKDMGEAIRLGPKVALFSYGRGETYFLMGQYDAAIKDYSNAIKLYPKYTSAYFNRGRAYIATNRNAEAIKDYDFILSANPNDVVAYHNRGLAYMSQKLYKEAKRDLDMAIKYSPKYAAAYYQRAQISFIQEDYDAAIKDYSSAISYNSNYVDAYFGRGRTYLRKKEYNKSIKDYDRVTSLSPNYTNAYVNRGLAYSKIKDYDSAIKNYNIAIEISPRAPLAYGNRGWIYYYKKDYVKSSRDADKAAKLGDSYLRDQLKKKDLYVPPTQ